MRRFSRLTSSVPPAVWVLVVLNVVLLLLSTYIRPNRDGPDEPDHIQLAVAVAQGRTFPWPDPGERIGSRAHRSAFFVRTPDFRLRLHFADEGALPPRSERQTFNQEEAVLDHELVIPHMLQHPPLYYLATGGMIAVQPDWEDQPFDRVWMATRWMNVIFAVPLPLIAWATAKRLGLPHMLAVSTAGAMLTIPALTRVMSSVNNDNLLILLGALFTWLTAKLLTGDRSRGTFVWAGVVATLAMLTKGFGLVLPAVLAAACLVVILRDRRSGESWRPALWESLISMAATLPGLGWYIRNRILFGNFQPQSGGFAGRRRTLSEFFADIGSGAHDGQPMIEWLTNIPTRFTNTFFGPPLGQIPGTYAWWAARVALLLLVLGLVAALVARTMPRLDAVILLLPAILTVPISMFGSFSNMVATGSTTRGMQGRYLFIGLVGILAVALSGAQLLAKRLQRFIPLAVLTAGLAMQALFAWAAIVLVFVPAYGSPLGRVAAGLRSAIGLHPFGPWPAILLVLIALAAVAYLTLCAARAAFPGLLPNLFQRRASASKELATVVNDDAPAAGEDASEGVGEATVADDELTTFYSHRRLAITFAITAVVVTTSFSSVIYRGW